jgi:hypothetical protein
MSTEELAELCEGCALNGKQSWSKNPLLTCCWHGGFYPALHLIEEVDGEEVRQCPSYRSAEEIEAIKR